MVKYQDGNLDQTFGALAHPIRRAILARLASGEASVSELARPFHVSAPAITKHMRILENAGLLSRTKDGRVHAFDDPGCLFVFLGEQQPDVHTIFFRHHRENRWIPRDRVGFVPAEKTPMGFGLAAVDATERDAIDFDQARQRCAERTSGHGGKR